MNLLHPLQPLWKLISCQFFPQYVARCTMATPAQMCFLYIEIIFVYWICSAAVCLLYLLLEASFIKCWSKTHQMGSSSAVTRGEIQHRRSWTLLSGRGCSISLPNYPSFYSDKKYTLTSLVALPSCCSQRLQGPLVPSKRVAYSQDSGQ